MPGNATKQRYESHKKTGLDLQIDPVVAGSWTARQSSPACWPVITNHQNIPCGDGEKATSLQVPALASDDRTAVISPRCMVTRPNTRSILGCVDPRFQPNTLQHSPSILKVLFSMDLETVHGEE